MSKYRPVYKKIWKDKDFLSLGKEAKLLFLYLITNESINNSGIYEIPIQTISNETGIGLPTVRQLLVNGSIKNIIYDLENEIAFVTNARKYCRGGNPINVEKGILSEFNHTSKTPLWSHFVKLNPYYEKKLSTVEQPLNNGSLPLPLPLPLNNNNNNNNNNKYKEISEKVISYLNAKAGRNYRFTDKNISLISSRLKDGNTENDCYYVIDVKVSQWLGCPNMDKNLRVKTLFAAINFDDYLNEKMKIDKKAKTNSKLEVIKKWGEENGKNNLSKGDGDVIDVGAKQH